MTLPELIDRTKAELNLKILRHNELAEQLNGLRPGGADAAREAELRQQRADVKAQMDTLTARLGMYEAELRDEERLEALDKRTAPTGAPTMKEERSGSRPDRLAAGTLVRSHDMRPAAVARGQRFAEHVVARDMIAQVASRDQVTMAQYGDLGQMVRALTTTGGAAVVPTVWAADVIDQARNLSAVMRAGAQIVPMDAKTVQIGRLTGDPTAAFRTEGSAITASDPTLDNVTLTATSMNALVIGSVEWFADADNSEALVSNAIAQAMATQLDLVGLYGSITSGAGSIDLPTPPNPRGILATLNALASTSVLGGATDGTTQAAASFYNELLDTLYTPKDFNETPNAMIYNSKLARLYSKAYDTTGQPLRTPGDLETVERFVSNQIPVYTKGAMASATDVFAGDFTQLLIGQRLDITLQVLTERYADTGQIGIVATWRGDIGITRPRAFSVFKALKAA